MGEHPASCRDPECDLPYVAHLRDIAVSAHATPNRRPDVVRIDRTEARWDRDGDAYKRIRKEGLQPEHVDGSAQLERTL